MAGTTSIFCQQKNRQNFIGSLHQLQFQKNEEMEDPQGEGLWRWVLESTQDGVWDWDALSGKVFYSDGWKAMRGFAPHEIGDVWDEWARCIHAEDRDSVMQVLKGHCEQQTPFDIEYRVLCKDNTYIWIRDRGQAFWDETGQLVRMIGSNLDITQMQASLRKSEERFRTLVDNLPEAIYRCAPDQDWTLDFISQAIATISGYSVADFIQHRTRTLASIRHPEDRERVTKEIMGAIAQKIPYRVTYRIIHATGDIRWMDEQGRGIFDEISSKLLYREGAIFDITPLKWEESLRNIKNNMFELMAQSQPLREIMQALTLQMNQLLPGIHSAMMMMDAKGQYLNPFVWSDMPLSYMQTLNKIAVGPTHGCCGRAAYLGQRVIAESVATDPLWDDYRDLILPYGFKSCWAVPIKSDADQVLGTLNLYFKENRVPEPRELKLIENCAELASVIITRKQSEEALFHSESLLRLTTDALPALIAYIDKNQCYQFVNQTYEAWHGKPRQEILGTSVRSLLGNSIYQQVKPHIEEVLLGYKVKVEKEIPFPSGPLLVRGVRHMSATYIPDFREDAVQGFFFLGNDVTQQKKMERMKDEFIAVISHELRTPLTSIHGALRLLAASAESDFSTDDQRILEIAVNSSDRLVRLVNDVLDLERMASGKAKVVKQFCNAADLLSQAVEGIRASAEEQDVTLSLQALSMSLWADPGQLHQVLTMLLSNAIKFSPPKTIVLLTVENQPREIVFKVRDQGKGIPADQLERVFERFQQVDASDSREQEGSGLGLAICQRIVHEHGGRIWAESVLNEGSCFCFTVPKFNESKI